MQIISSYGVELRKQNIPIRQTLEIYRSAVSYLIGIYVQVWEKLAEIPDAKRRFNAAEHLVHTTKKNHACFDFDIRFPKMPSYLRRSAIQHALGTVSSYKTRLDLWEKTDGKSGKPKLVYENHAMPVFYRDVMYREGAEGKDEAYLKLYDGHDWKWFCADTGKMGIYETSEYRTGQKDCRCDCKICGRKPCRCDRVRVSGDAGEDIGKEKTETAPVEKKRYPEVL